MAEKRTDEETDDKTKELTTERLLKALKVNVARKIQAGEVGLASEIERIKDLEDRINKTNTPQPPLPSGGGAPEPGVPEHLRLPRRSYTMSESARLQRQKAAKSPEKVRAMKGNKNAYKHGGAVKSFIESFIRPCKSTCPDYPCTIVAEGGTKPGGDCLDKSQILDTFRSIQTALRDKTNPERYSGINDIISLKVAGAVQIVTMLQEDILRDGTILKREKWNKDGEVMGFEIVQHPSLLLLPKMLADIGLTLTDLHVTPKAVTKSEDDEEAINSLASALSRAGSALKSIKDKESCR